MAANSVLVSPAFRALNAPLVFTPVWSASLWWSWFYDIISEIHNWIQYRGCTTDYLTCHYRDDLNIDSTAPSKIFFHSGGDLMATTPAFDKLFLAALATAGCTKENSTNADIWSMRGKKTTPSCRINAGALSTVFLRNPRLRCNSLAVEVMSGLSTLSATLIVIVDFWSTEREKMIGVIVKRYCILFCTGPIYDDTKWSLLTTTARKQTNKSFMLAIVSK